MLGPTIQTVDYSRTEGTELARSAVRELKAVVAGAGALGNEVVRVLGLLGCGQVLVVDQDVIEPHNLSRSLLFRREDAVGRNKAEKIVEACRHYFPDTTWQSVNTEVADVGLARIAESDLIFSCVDNELARLEIAYIGTKLDRPVCDAGLGGENYLSARVSFFPTRQLASFCCLLPPSRRRQLLTQWDSPVFPCWIKNQETREWPGTPTMASVAGSMQVEIGLRQLFRLRRSEPIDAQTTEFTFDPPRLTTFRIPLGSGCPFHEEMPERWALLPADSRMTVKEFLGSFSHLNSQKPVLLLDWPICVSAKCRNCGYGWRPMQRIAAFRRSSICPRCGKPSVWADSVVHRIALDSPFSSYRLRELGMPDQQLYTVELSRGEEL